SHHLLSSSSDGTIRAWNFATPTFEPKPYDFSCGQAQRIGPRRSDKGAIVSSPDGSSEARFGAGPGVQLLERGSNKPIGPRIRLEELVQFARFSADGTRLITQDAKEIRVWNLSTGTTVGLPLSIP